MNRTSHLFNYVTATVLTALPILVLTLLFPPSGSLGNLTASAIFALFVANVGVPGAGLWCLAVNGWWPRSVGEMLRQLGTLLTVTAVGYVLISVVYPANTEQAAQAGVVRYVTMAHVFTGALGFAAVVFRCLYEQWRWRVHGIMFSRRFDWYHRLFGA